jgi:hypothetical protein
MWLARVLGIQTFSEHFLPEKISSALSVIIGGKVHEVIILVALYNLFLYIIIMFMYLKKLKWFLKVVIICALYAAHYIAIKLNLMYYQEGWFFPFTTIAIFSMYLYVYILDRLYGPNIKTPENI